MDLRRGFGRLEQHLDVMSRWVTYLLVLMSALGLVSRFVAWGKHGPFVYLRNNLQSLWLLTVTFATLTLWIWISRLHRRFVSGFSDDFSGDLRAGWDFEGPWRIPEKGTLLVTGSDAGGITKVGAQWENYTFTFRARIINQYLGVVVRAQDLSNYYMFQIQTDKIRPHRRVAVPVVEAETSLPSDEEDAPQEAPRFLPVGFNVGWIVFDPPTPLSRTLDEWFDVKVNVRGESVLIYIDGELVFQRDSFLKIPVGKVGFRSAGSEEALVRGVRVTLET